MFFSVTYLCSHRLMLQLNLLLFLQDMECILYSLCDSCMSPVDSDSSVLVWGGSNDIQAGTLKHVWHTEYVCYRHSINWTHASDWHDLLLVSCNCSLLGTIIRYIQHPSLLCELNILYTVTSVCVCVCLCVCVCVCLVCVCLCVYVHTHVMLYSTLH